MVLGVQIEEGLRGARVWLGAFSKCKHFVRFEAGLRSTVVKLELLVVLGLNNIPAHHLRHLLHPIVKCARGICIVKFFSLSLNQ